MNKHISRSEKQINEIPIMLAKAGDTVRVDKIQSGETLRHRLAELGISQGSILDIVRNQTSGPIVVKTKGSNIILGTGMSYKIFVHIVKNKNNEEQL